MRRHYLRITEAYHNLHPSQKRLRIKRTRSIMDVYGSFYLRGGNSVMFEPTMSCVSFETRLQNYTINFNLRRLWTKMLDFCGFQWGNSGRFFVILQPD